MARDDVVRYLDDYRDHHALDVRCGVSVDGVERIDSGYRLRVGSRPVTAGCVVVATGCYHTPALPSWDEG